MQLIDGKLVAKTIREDLKQKIAEAYDKYGKKFTLTVIIAGEDPASQIYVRGKARLAKKRGLFPKRLSFPKRFLRLKLRISLKKKSRTTISTAYSFNFRYRAISTRRACLNLSRPKKTLTASARAI